jgi:hypothetical protein
MPLHDLADHRLDAPLPVYTRVCMALIASDPADLRERLDLLRVERELARAVGLDADAAYMAALERELAVWEAAWIGAVVTEIAVARAGVSGRPQG